RGHRHGRGALIEDAVLVALQLTLELLGHQVRGGVRVQRALLGTDDATRHVQLHLDLSGATRVLVRVVRHDDAGVDDLIGDAAEAADLLLSVLTHGVGDFYVATHQFVDVHVAPFGQLSASEGATGLHNWSVYDLPDTESTTGARRTPGPPVPCRNSVGHAS